MDYSLLAIPLAGGLRSFAGWLENALKDGKIDTFEWGKLFGTILEVAVISVAALYGLNLSAESAAGVGLLGSFLLSGLKN